MTRVVLCTLGFCCRLLYAMLYAMFYDDVSYEIKRVLPVAILCTTIPVGNEGQSTRRKFHQGNQIINNNNVFNITRLFNMYCILTCMVLFGKNHMVGCIDHL